MSDCMDRDIEENHTLYAALGGCSCEKCEGEPWYVETATDQGEANE